MLLFPVNMKGHCSLVIADLKDHTLINYDSAQHSNWQNGEEIMVMVSKFLDANISARHMGTFTVSEPIDAVEEWRKVHLNHWPQQSDNHNCVISTIHAAFASASRFRPSTQDPRRTRQNIFHEIASTCGFTEIKLSDPEMEASTVPRRKWLTGGGNIRAYNIAMQSRRAQKKFVQLPMDVTGHQIPDSDDE